MDVRPGSDPGCARPRARRRAPGAEHPGRDREQRHPRVGSRGAGTRRDIPHRRTTDAAGDPERTRSHIEGGTFAGIATTYAFSASRHLGVDPREIALLAWQGGRAVIAR